MNESRPGTGGKRQPSTADTGTAGPELLAHALGAISRDLQQQDDPDSLRAGIVAAAVAVVPGAEEGSISVVTDRRRVGSQAATSDLPARVDTLQEKTRQGPCLQVMGGWRVPQNRWVSRQPSTGTQPDGTPTDALRARRASLAPERVSDLMELAATGSPAARTGSASVTGRRLDRVEATSADVRVAMPRGDLRDKPYHLACYAVRTPAASVAWTGRIRSSWSSARSINSAI